MIPPRLPTFPHVRPSQFLRFTRPPISPPPSNSHLHFHRLQTRTMSTAPKKEFLCILPDKPGAQAKRLEVRPLVTPHPGLITISSSEPLDSIFTLVRLLT